MKHWRQTAIAAAIICGLPALSAVAASTASGGERSDVREENELLQQRLEQLAQAIPNAGTFYTQGEPPAPTAAPVSSPATSRARS